MEKNNWRTFLTGIIVSFLTTSIMINAPSLFQGYGPQVLGMIIVALILSPKKALASYFIGHLLAIPVLIFSHALFPLVAFLSLVIRPLGVYLVSLSKEKWSYFIAGLVGGSFDAVISTLISVLYYGDDGIHTGLSVFGIITGALASIAYVNVKNGNYIDGLISSASILVYLFSSFAYLSPIGLLSFIPILLIYLQKKETQALSIVSAIILLIALAGSITTLAVNFNIMAYPYKPSSWSNNRWAVDSPLCGYEQNVFSHTYDPERLRIVGSCISIEGTVSGIPKMYEDGDYCFDLENVNNTNVLSGGNLVLRKGKLHVEIVPNDRENLLNNLGGKICSGDKIIVYGPLVVDTDHGQWSEIHPAKGIFLLQRGQGPCILIQGND